MPLLYGEGGVRAFRRLQLEIISSSLDLSILAFGQDSHKVHTGILASHPSQFADCEGFGSGAMIAILSRTTRGIDLEASIPFGWRSRYFRKSRLVIWTLDYYRNINLIFELELPRNNYYRYDDGFFKARRVGCFKVGISDSFQRPSSRDMKVKVDEMLSAKMKETINNWWSSIVFDKSFGTARKLRYFLFPPRKVKFFVPLFD
jgi:hypothetical protein